MYYRKYQPTACIASFVECYFVWDSEGPLQEPLIVESPPNGFCSIVFNYGDAYDLQNKKYPRLTVPKQFISGQNIHTYKLFLQGSIGMAGIVLKPTALASIYGLPVYEYTEERIDLYDVFKKDMIDRLSADIRNANEEQRIQLLEAFV